jgi:parvulin-like peptidyl-prolyl isomerase
MSNLDTVIASLTGTKLSLGGLLRRLHAQGRLEPLAREALAAQLIQDQARQAGLSATPQELQAAADSFRRRAGLNAAADTNAWLAQRKLSVEDLEAALEQDLLAAKLRSHLAAGKAEQAFGANKAGYDRLVLDQLVLPREDIASELASQIRDEGREFADVAREQGLAPIRFVGLRKQLGGPVADALAQARAGQVVGPIGMANGFVLIRVEALRPADLDAPTRRQVEQDLFETWLASQMQQASVDLQVAGAP